MALEEEIQCLRATVRNIQLENSILRNALDLHGITALTNYSPPVPGNDTARVTLSGPPGPHQFLQVQTHDFHAFPAPVQGTKNAISSRNAAQLLGDAVGQQIGIGNEQYATPTIGTRHPCQSSSPPASSIGALDSEFAGFHFVLTYELFIPCWVRRAYTHQILCRLEHPCLQHTGHPSISSGMSGHALTLNAAALACAPSCIRPDEVWSVPTSSLERLLDLSAGLGMEPGKITPIQAWQCLREHPDFAILTPERLQELISKLSNEVKCHG